MPFGDAAPRHACFALSLFVRLGAPSYRWTPHEFEFAQAGSEFVVGAILVYEGDLAALIAADAELLGSIRAGDRLSQQQATPRDTAALTSS